MSAPDRHHHPSRPPAASAAAPRTLLGVAALLAAGACGGDPTATADAPIASARTAAAEHHDLATLRAATARFHRLETANAAGYTFLFMNMCMADGSGAGRGAMGEHYVNPQLLDGAVDVATPEALLYEPGANGQRRLVGVEYVVPASEWDGDAPPSLFGRDFTRNAFDLWALHVWVWRENPSGTYADWNPRVSCASAAPAAATAAHH